MSMKEVDKNLLDVPDDATRPEAVRLTDGTAFYKGTTPTDTQPISATSLPLPTGAATEASLATIAGTVSAGRVLVDANITTDIEIGGVEIKNATDDTRAVVKTDGTNNALVVYQNVQVLPTGASTSAKQDTGNASLASIDTKLTDQSQFTRITDGTDTALVTGTGELSVLASAQPGVDIGDVTVNNASGASAVNIQDGGNSITVDGTVTSNIGTTGGLALNATLTDKSQFAKITDGTDTALVTGSGELNVLATAQPGVDIGDVTINNASGASAVNIQDGGNSITVDGTVITALGTTNPNLGISAFDLSGANSNQSSVDLNTYITGSIQLVWTGATSSDAFVTPGIIAVEVSNNDSNWESLISYSISAASGQVLSRAISVDFRYIRTTWTKNASTAGSATISTTFKSA